MANKVIRLGGSHLANSVSLNNLKKYVASCTGRSFIAVSAVSSMLQILEKGLDEVFTGQEAPAKVKEQLLQEYRNITAEQVSPTYAELTQQVANLLRGIALIGDYSVALKDQVLSYAEKLSLEILNQLWSEATVLFPEDIDLRATSDYGNASFLSLNKEKLQALPNGVYIIPGTYGITETGKIARSGKNAADYTAAFITRELNAERLELWDLDHDFLRADPKIISNLSKIKRLTYAEASELAYFDHYSFHPRTVEPLENKHIPIEVLASDSDEGIVETTINTETFIEEQIVKSVAYSDNISLLKLDGPGVGLKPGILARVTSQLNESGLNIKSVITSQTSINFILSRENGDKALALLDGLGFSAVTDISVVKDISLIGIVGHGMQHAYGVSAKIFSAVAKNKINVVLSGSGASDLVSYLVVQNTDKEKSIREIYKVFFS